MATKKATTKKSTGKKAMTKEKETKSAKKEAKVEPKKAEKKADKKAKPSVRKQAQTRKSIKKKQFRGAPAPRAKGKVMEYQPNQTYAVGDMIYHPVWGSEGKVVEVGQTADGLGKMTVDFGRSGLKKLVMGYSVNF